MLKPKTVAALLVGGTFLLWGGSAFVAALPSGPSPAALGGTDRETTTIAPEPTSLVTRPSTVPTTDPPTTTTVPKPRPTATKPKVKPHKAAPATTPTTVQTLPPISYTVKSGDTLSGIAAWFWLHGYGGLYEANKAVIGSNPNLIFPGQVFTISGGVMTASTP